MESFQHLMNGFAIALQPGNLVFAFIGCILGTLVGVLPGLGPSATIAILLPISFALDPTPAIIMLSAIYYGAQYGGTITSVLVNTPGEASSAATCLDGYAMAKQGRAGAALSVAAIGSFVGGNVATLGLVFMAAPVARAALGFGPPELFALMLLALTMITALAGKSMVRGMAAAAFGMLIATIGVDEGSGMYRFIFGQQELLDGVNIVPVMMGLFGISEILVNAEKPGEQVFVQKIESLWMTAKDARDSFWPVVRGTLIGLLGIIPGVGTVAVTFMSYTLEKKLSKTPELFGTGMIEGVAGPETANNSSANVSLVPLLTLGIPPSVTSAVLIGAFIMHGLTPGPLLFREHADFVWAVIASLYIGNLMLLILNLPLIPMWVVFLRTPYPILSAVILLFCVVGAYSVRGTAFDIWVMLLSGVVGYWFKKTGIPVAPVVLTLILGPLMERGVRQALQMSGGDYSIFITRPAAGILLVMTFIVILWPVVRSVARKRAGDKFDRTIDELIDGQQA